MRTIRSLLLALPIALAAGCGSEGTGTSVDASTAALELRAWDALAGGNKLLPVMSRNLYLGADLTPVVLAGDQQAFLAATTAVWAMVQNNDFHVRVEALADEIATERPALIGLQEAYTWRIQSPSDFVLGGTTPATEVVYDYVPELLAALAERGLVYRVAAEVELFDFEAPVASATSPNGFDDVRLTDHGVILARGDVHTEDGEGHVFPEVTLLPLPVAGQVVLVERGWVSTRVKYRGEWLRFVSTHLEAFSDVARVAQATVLAAELAGETLPTVLVGDLNSLPGTEGEAVLAATGFEDAWETLEGPAPGLTCCFAEDLTLPDALETRIDYVLYRGALVPRSIEVVGDEAQVSGLWPSDHAGVSAVLRIALPGGSGTGRHP